MIEILTYRRAENKTDNDFSIFFSSIRMYLKKLFRSKRADQAEAFERIHHLDRTGDYFNYHTKVQPGFVIDSRTWLDLDMDQLFLKLDYSLSTPGEQVLYALLHRPCLGEAEFETRRRLIDIFLKNENLRGQIGAILKGLGHSDDGDFLARYLWGSEITPAPIRKRAVYWVAYFAVFTIPLWFMVSSVLGIYSFLGLFMVNTFLHAQAQRKLQTQLGTITYLGRMLQAAVKLSNLQAPGLESYQNTFQSAKHTTKRLRRKLALGVFLSRSFDMLLAPANILLLIEVRAYFSALHLVNRDRRGLQEVYSATGFLDAMQAVVSYRESLAYYCEPEFMDAKSELNASGIYHPLVTEPVANDICLTPVGIVLTGSNMSGKSTFLKTIGVNVLLAQTIFTVTAKSYSSSLWRLMSAIGRTDNLIEGKSYYLDEALAVLRIIQLVDQNPVNCLLIMDELFRGTNSGERVAAAVALLHYLADKGCCTLLATHDMEITRMIAGLYRNCHFQERIGEKGLLFDYQLLEGPSQRTNAIEILKYVGYPMEIINEANQIVGQCSKTC